MRWRGLFRRSNWNDIAGSPLGASVIASPEGLFLHINDDLVPHIGINDVSDSQFAFSAERVSDWQQRTIMVVLRDVLENRRISKMFDFCGHIYPLSRIPGTPAIATTITVRFTLKELALQVSWLIDSISTRIKKVYHSTLCGVS